MSNAVLIGEFNSEKYWRDKEYSKLPEFKDKNINNVIRSMDELLFVLTKPKDVLITKYRFDSVLKDYLRTIGFDFLSTNENIEISKKFEEDSIFKVLYKNLNILNKVFPCDVKEMSLSPYSALKYCNELAHSLKLNYNGCDPEVVRRVNSKVYSQNLCKELELKYCGEVINSHKDLEMFMGDVKFENGILIKDPYGVSGKGNMLLNSPALVKRISKHLKAQEDKGFKTVFVVEPFLQKKIDFSCGFNISKEGKVKIISIQKMINYNFSYLGSITADKDFIDYLNKNKYFDIVDNIGKRLYGDGYFGDVCVDSMILVNGDIVPIVEINCRKSMGFINHYLDEYLKKYNLKGSLCFLNLGYGKDLNFQRLFSALDNNNVIFYPNLSSGLIPISSNTLFINKDLDEEQREDTIYKGRYYMCIVAKDDDERQSILNKIKGTLNELTVHVYN